MFVFVIELPRGIAKVFGQISTLKKKAHLAYVTQTLHKNSTMSQAPGCVSSTSIAVPQATAIDQKSTLVQMYFHFLSECYYGALHIQTIHYLHMGRIFSVDISAYLFQ